MKLYVLKIHPFAESELMDARKWYNFQKENLGDEFIGEVEAKLKQIISNPHRFRKIRSDVRVAVLKRFPFSVVFSIAESHVEIYSFFHHSRNPKIWKRRTK